MATINRENIAPLIDKVTVTLSKEDYIPSFEQSLKKYAKNANIPGFRKGMVPSGLVKKMYGQSVFTDEVLRTVEKELNNYMTSEQLEIFAQPLPLETDSRTLDMNKPEDYAFAFEIGLKPEFNLDLSKVKVTRYKVDVTDGMVDEELNRLRLRHGKMTEPETVSGDEQVLTLQFTEEDESGNPASDGISKASSVRVNYFNPEFRNKIGGLKKDDSFELTLNNAFEDKERDYMASDLGLDKENQSDLDKKFRVAINRIGLVEPADMNEEFFEKAYAGREIKSEQELRDAVKADIQAHFDAQAANQVHDQIYHALVEHTKMDFPADFLKRWLRDGSQQKKSEEEAEKEYPSFESQLKWSLISTRLVNDNKIAVDQKELRENAKQQMLGYMGGQSLGDAPWLDSYIDRMMQDQKFVENTYFQVQNTKLFQLLEGQVQSNEEAISSEKFQEKLHHHHH